jgi:hypothetical protein
MPWYLWALLTVTLAAGYICGFADGLGWGESKK